MKEIFKYEQTGLKIIGKLDPDQLKIFVDATINPPREVTFEEIYDYFLNYSKKDLLHEEVIRDIAQCLTRGEKIEERRVAKGFPPQTGADGKVIFLARRIELKGGAVAPKYEGTPLQIENIEKGRQIARVYKPKAGTPGRSAMGQELPAQMGKPSTMKWNTSISVTKGDESYDILVAQNDGFFSEEQEELSVRDELVFQEDFDHRYGSVDYCGSVRVKGDVLTDSFISARRGVFIAGGVLAGTVIRSSDGPIEIHGAVNGGNSARFKCAGPFICAVLQQAEVESRGDIIVSKEAHSSLLRAQGKFIAEKAQIFGMQLYASDNVWIGKLGNKVGVQTVIHLCSDVETRSEFQNLVREIENHDKAEHLLELHLGPVAKNPARINYLQAAHRVRIEGLFKKYREVQKSKASLIAQREEKLLTALGSLEMSVNVAGVIYPGAEVVAGNILWKCIEEKKGPTAVMIVKDAKEFTFGEFKAFVEDPKDSKQKDVKKETKK